MPTPRTARARRRIAATRAVLAGLVLLATACTASDDVSLLDERSTPTIGMRAGGGLFDLTRFEAEEARLGRRFGYTVQFTGRRSVEDMTGSAFGLLAGPDAELPLVADRLELSLTVPLAFGRATPKTDAGVATIRESLTATAAGAHDDAYRRVADRLVENGFGDAVLRLAHEFNGGWPPYSSRGNEREFIAAWRHVHDVFAEISPTFRFDWTAMRPMWAETVPEAFPGDDVVDIVGLDVYWRAEDLGSSWSDAVWTEDFLPVLEAQLQFAIEHDKQVSFPEWGIAGADVPEFVEAMHDWFAALPEDGPGSLAYQAYFNTNGQYALANYERSAEAYVRLFSDDSN